LSILPFFFQARIYTIYSDISYFFVLNHPSSAPYPYNCLQAGGRRRADVICGCSQQNYLTGLKVLLCIFSLKSGFFRMFGGRAYQTV